MASKQYKRFCVVQCILFGHPSARHIGTYAFIASIVLSLKHIRKLAGLALRQCIELGYHQSNNRLKTPGTPVRLNLCKRVFWCAYSLETQAAVMLGRPLGIPCEGVGAEVGNLVFRYYAFSTQTDFALLSYPFQ